MSRYAEIHHQAMAKVDDYYAAKKRNNLAKAHEALLAALRLETEAASLVAGDLEPTRSVLFRSAASLAMMAGRSTQVTQLVATALRGSPPDDVKEELLELLLSAPPESADAMEPPPVAADTLVQTLTIRRGQSGRGKIPFSLATRIQEHWLRLYQGTSDDLFDIFPRLFPLQASPGSYTLRIQVDLRDDDKDSAFAAFRAIAGRQQPAESGPATRKGLALSSSFLALMSTLEQYSAQLEVRMCKVGDDGSEESFRFHPLAKLQIQQLHQQATEYVDSSDVPQADTLTKVFRFVDIIASGRYPRPSDLDVGERQVYYYRRATEILGYLDDGVLTPAGDRIAALKSEGDRLRSAAVHFESCRVGSAWIRWAKVNSLHELPPDSAIEFLESRAIGLTGKTIGRRAASIRRWCETLAPYHYQHPRQPRLDV